MPQEDYDLKYKEWKEAQERKKRYAATFTPGERRDWIAKKRSEENRESKRDVKLYYRHELPNKQASPRKRDDSSGETLTCS